MIQTIIVIAIVALAGAYCIRAARRTLQGRSTCGCAGKCPAASTCDSKDKGCS